MNTATNVIEPVVSPLPIAGTVVPLPRRAVVEDLFKVEHRAEIIGGKIVLMAGTGDLPGVVALNVAVSLRLYARTRRVGVTYGDNTIYALRPPLPDNERETFLPDASYYTGPRPVNRMDPITGTPDLAVEVRSKGDYGRAAERDMADKRADYFRAGTLVVWDVDPVAEIVAVYRADAPELPTIYHRGEIAEAEPAAPGWRMAVDEVFAD